MMGTNKNLKNSSKDDNRVLDEKEMANKRRFKYRLHLLVAAANMITLAAFSAVYTRLPQQMPSHWSFTGEIQSYMSKKDFIWLMLLPVGLYLMMEFLPRIDPRRKSYDQHYRAYGFFELFMVLFMIGMQWLAISASLGAELDMPRISIAGIGLMFVVIGNFMPQIRPNYFYGIKTPWTLASEEVWRKTHRMGGFVYTIAGLTAFLANFFISKQFALPLFILLMVVLFIPVAYSYVIFKKIEQ